MQNQALELWESLSRLEGLMHRYQGHMFRAHGPRGNPARGQGRVLAALAAQPGATQKELGETLDMRQQSLSEILAKLERGGLVSRAPSADDRRAAVVTLTGEGREMAEKMGEKRTDAYKVLDVLDAGEQRQLLEYLARLAGAFDKELQSMDGCCGAGQGHGGRRRHRGGNGRGKAGL